MFKSVFGRYLTAFYAIILVCFFMLFMIVSSIAVNYATEAKQASVKQVGDAVSEYIDEHCGADGDLRLIETQEMQTMLRLAASSADELGVCVSDENGSILACENSLGRVPLDIRQIPDAIHNELKKGKVINDADSFEDLLGSGQLVTAIPLSSDGNVYYGAVVVFSPAEQWSQLFNVMTKTIVMASLLIMLAALIAVYFISERVTAPLRDMSRAAKDFAAGIFSRRVTVHGNDEIAELAIAFNQMAKSLENLEKMRSNFMANVSHDLKTPMTTIAGFIDGIRDGVIPPEKQDYYLGVVSSEVQRLSRLVSSLLDLSRIQAGDRQFVMKTFDICEMGRQILISFEQQLEQKKLQVEFVCDEDNLFVVADHDAIYQIFYNICDNAVKFSYEGGSYRINIQRNKKKDKKNKIEISVYNEGQGIAAEDLPFVFERFFKADKSRGLDKKGVGLGLYIAKTIVTAHGEEIWVTSEPGKDCQFSFTLPEATPALLAARKREEKTERANRAR